MKKKKGKLGLISALGLGVGLGFVAGEFLGYVTSVYLGDSSAGEMLIVMLLMLLGAYVALLLQLVLHEGGHLVFGLATGYKFSSFRVFNFMWVKLDGKIRLKRLSIVGTAGQCLMEPPQKKGEKFPFALYNLGGVIVNLVTAAFAAGLAFLAKGVLALFVFLLLFAFMGVVLGVTNGIPLRVGQIENDGANLLSVRKNEQAATAFYLQMQVNAEIAKGRRLKDMPPERFSFPAEGMENTMVATMGVFRANYLMDCHRFAEAKALMEELIDGGAAVVGVHENLMRLDLVYIALAIEGDKARANELWTKKLQAFSKSMKNFPSVIRTQYVYELLYNGSELMAGEHLTSFEKTAKAYPYESDIQSERELIELARRKEQKE